MAKALGIQYNKALSHFKRVRLRGIFGTKIQLTTEDTDNYLKIKGF